MAKETVLAEDAHGALEALSRTGVPSTGLARVQRHLGEEEVARETFRSAAIKLGERAAARVARDGFPKAARACLRVAEAWLEAGEVESARRAIVDVVPHAAALPLAERARVGFVLARVGDTEDARGVLAELPPGPAQRALAAVLDDRNVAEEARELEAAIVGRGVEGAKPWADSVWWDVVRWMRGGAR